MNIKMLYALKRCRAISLTNKTGTREKHQTITVNGESFAGLNFRGFDPIYEVFRRNTLRFIGQECSQLYICSENFGPGPRVVRGPLLVA